MDKYEQILSQVASQKATLVAVSKTKPKEAILELYDKGQRHFGENKVQELVEKQDSLPKDIHWHQIGHLQTNKVKYIAPFVHLIHAVDSLKLLKEINKQGKKNQRKIACLLQVKIAREDTKFGLNPESLVEVIESVLEDDQMSHISIHGLMGMASFTSNEQQVAQEFATLKTLFDKLKGDFPALGSSFTELSMGMSGDYLLALDHGSTMVRIGSLLFGSRN